jgi:hypothetical protein
MEFLGMMRFEPTDTDKLLPSLCDVVRAGVGGDHLLTATRKLLYENRFVIPGTRRLSNLMQAAVSSVEHDALSATYLLTWCLVETRHLIEAQYRHIKPEWSPISYPLDPVKMAQSPIPHWRRVYTPLSNGTIDVECTAKSKSGLAISFGGRGPVPRAKFDRVNFVGTPNEAEELSAGAPRGGAPEFIFRLPLNDFLHWHEKHPAAV